MKEDSGLASLETNLNRRRSELLTQLSGLAPSSPLRKGVEQELASIQAELDRASLSALNKTSKELMDRLVEVLRTKIIEGKLQTETDRLTAQVYLLGKLRSANEELGSDLDQIRERLNAINNREEYRRPATLPDICTSSRPRCRRCIPKKAISSS